MAVGFVAAGAIAATTTATLNITAPACSVNDILVACIIQKLLGASITAPDGTWTNITFGTSDCTTAADDHSFTLFWKRATASNGSFAFTTDLPGTCFAGAIVAYSGCPTTGDVLDGTAANAKTNAAAADNVTFNAFDPTETNSEILFVAFYGNDLTTFAAAMSSDTNPDCTKRLDVETGTGNDASIALASGPTTDGSNIASRTWASVSTTDAGSTGVVFGLKPAPPSGLRLLASLGVGI